MSAPSLTQYNQGVGEVDADGLNTFQQTCNTYSQLRAFVGAVGQQVAVRGGATIGDQYAGVFYWSSGATAPDNGVTVIAPIGAAQGRWLRIAYYSQAAQSALVINVQDFGATGNGVTDDSAAINAAFTYMRSQTTVTNNAAYGFIVYFPPGTYLVQTTINATYIDTICWGIRGPGKILGRTNGQPVLDLTNSRWCHLEDVYIYADTTLTPNVGILIARGYLPSTTTVWFCDVMLLENVTVFGNFTTACLFNYASEDTTFVKCEFINQDSSATSYCLMQDGDNSTGMTSPYVTIPANNQQSFNNDTLIGVECRKTVGGPAIFTRRACGHKYINCYGVSVNDDVVVVSVGAGTPTQNLSLGVHIETSGSQSAVRFTGASTMTISGFEFIDMAPQASQQILEADAGVSLITITNININISTWGVTPANGLYSDGSKFNVMSGRIYTPNALYNRNYADTQPGWVTGRYYYFSAGTTVSAWPPVANRLHFSPLIVPRSRAIDRIGFNVTNAATSASYQCRVGIYGNGQGQPNFLILDAGLVNVGTGTGLFTATVNQTLPDGPLWIAIIGNANGGAAGNPQIRSWVSDSSNLIAGLLGDGDTDPASIAGSFYADLTIPSWPSFVLPTTAPAVTYATDQLLVLGVRAA